MIADTFHQKTGSNTDALQSLTHIFYEGFSLGGIPSYLDYKVNYDPEIIVPTIEDFKVVCDLKCNNILIDQNNLYVEIVVPTIEDFEEICEENNPNFPLGEFDATKWASEFKKIGVELGYLSKDISDAPGDWLHVWFCCAIMTGYDHAIQQMNERGTDALQELDEWEEELFHDEFCFWGV